MIYDDADISCPMCALGMDASRLCECDDDPMCWRCHQINHVIDRRRVA